MKLRLCLPSVILSLCLSLISLGQDRSTAALGPGRLCTPVYFQETARKIFRHNYMYFQGLADLTGDGRPDAYGYELHVGDVYRNIVVLPNDNAGSFGDPIIVNTTLPIELRFSDSVVGDLNGDGRTDFVLRTATAPPAIFTMRSNGNGSYSQSAPTLLGSEIVAVIADINADGRGDIVTYGNSLYFRLGNPDGTFGPAVQPAPQQNVSAVVVGNFSGDEKPDIAFTYLDTILFIYRYQLLTNLGGGAFSASAPVSDDMGEFSGTADLNEDGLLDIYGRNTLTFHSISELLNNGNGTFTKVDMPLTPLPDFGANLLAGESPPFLADVNGDGHKDLIERVDVRQGPTSVAKRFANIFVNNGAAAFTKSILRQPFLGLPADMNGDGKDEQVVFANSTVGLQRFSAANEPVVIVRSPVCIEPARTPRTQLIDFGGDGISDIVVWRPASNMWQWASNLIGGTFSWGLSADLPAPGDFDGDGKTDASVFRPDDGTWYVFRSATGTVTATQFGLSGDLPVAGDYNGDGKTDIVVFRPSDGNWYIWFTDTQQYLSVPWGHSGDMPVPNDYDGDHKIDIAVFRPSEGNWYYLRSSDGSIGAYNWGLTTDLPVPADYDMDGRADLCVFRPDNRVWYILRSFDGALTAYQFGQPGNLPMAVDSDGDGIMELAVYDSIGTLAHWRTTAQVNAHWGTFAAGTPVRIFLQNN